MKLTKKEKELFEAFTAGFQTSGEGFNGEYPFGDVHGKGRIKAIQKDDEIQTRFQDFISKIRMRKI